MTERYSGHRFGARPHWQSSCNNPPRRFGRSGGCLNIWRGLRDYQPVTRDDFYRELLLLNSIIARVIEDVNERASKIDWASLSDEAKFDQFELLDSEVCRLNLIIEPRFAFLSQQLAEMRRKGLKTKNIRRQVRKVLPPQYAEELLGRE